MARNVSREVPARHCHAQRGSRRVIASVYLLLASLNGDHVHSDLRQRYPRKRGWHGPRGSWWDGVWGRRGGVGSHTVIDSQSIKEAECCLTGIQGGSVPNGLMG